jgi:hypothetical protein
MNRGALAFAGVLVVGLAVVLIVDLPAGRPAAPAASATVSPTASAAPTPSPDLGAASAAARRFLDSYLPFLYGRAPLSSVGTVDDGVRAGLPAGRQEIGADERGRSPSIHDVQVQPGPAGGALVVALIEERDPTTGAASTYPLRFQMTDRPRTGWVVSTVPTLG